MCKIIVLLKFLLVHSFFIFSQSNLDDSGFSSPSKRSGIAFDKKIQFYVENLSNRRGVRDSVIAHKEDTLADALRQNYPKMMKNINNILFWAEIRSHNEMKCVNPFLLACGFIQPETTLRMEERSETTYDYSMDLKNTKPYSKLQGCVFFISIQNRKRLQAITKVHYADLRYRDICVYAAPFQTYREALIMDRRFINVSQFTIKQKQTEGGATIGMDQKPLDFSKELTLDVQVNKSARGTTGKPAMSTPKSTQSSIGGESPSDIQNSSFKTPKKNPNFKKLTGEMWKENTIYAFSEDVSDMKNDEMTTEMEKCLKARAWFTLIGPEDHGKKLESALARIVQIQFSNNYVVSRPVRFTKALSELYDSVGLLKCGSITATCFLVSKDVIATNWHVVNDIRKARRASTPHNYSEVYVHFDFEDDEKRHTLANGHRLMPLTHDQNQIVEALDYALLFIETPIEELKGLGEFVRSTVPQSGKVCIVGHPNGNEKQDELCAILPLHDGRRALELERKFAENEMNCRNNPSRCTLSFARQRCVHSYQPQLQNLCQQRETITYNVGSMGKGASGAPVFDMKCNIVALHTGGFAVGDGNSSIVEYAITFKAIVQHLQANLPESVSPTFVKDLFPNCLVEDMEIDDS